MSIATSGVLLTNPEIKAVGIMRRAMATLAFFVFLLIVKKFIKDLFRDREGEDYNEKN